MYHNPSVREQSKRRVAYYYDDNIGSYYYGFGHVMKPHRIRMAHALICSYDLYQKLQIVRPTPAKFEDMTRFHSDEYITFLKNAKADDVNLYGSHVKNRFSINANDDCPVFDGLYEFCQLSCGGSLAAAIKLNKKQTDIAINWMGGLHHAKKSEAAGFCYTNDIVVGILELLKVHKRVLYVDIDIHHGDGVEEAFYTSDRVMTVSFHRYGDFFPGTGDIKDVGAEKGKLYSVNVPLLNGITDEAYHSVFKPVMTRVMERFDPSAVVLQCGADSLNGDRLGTFNLTVHGHGECAKFFRKYNVPLMLVGGGGYTPRNVSRCWAYETSVAVDLEVPNELPYNQYYEYYGPEYLLNLPPSAIRKNDNSYSTLVNIQNEVFVNLDQLNFVPSVQMQPIPEDCISVLEAEKVLLDKSDPDKLLPTEITDRIIQDEGDFYDSERAGDDRRNECNGNETMKENGCSAESKI